MLHQSQNSTFLKSLFYQQSDIIKSQIPINGEMLNIGPDNRCNPSFQYQKQCKIQLTSTTEIKHVCKTQQQTKQIKCVLEKRRKRNENMYCECEMTTMLTLNTEGLTETTQHTSLIHQRRSGNNCQNRTKAGKTWPKIAAELL